MFHNVKFKPKDMIPIPWMVAMALQADGWYLRQDIIWHKPNPMPESVTDRCTKAHEYIFLLSKNARYYYDAEAVAEPAEKAGQILHAYNSGAKDRKDVSDTNDRRTRISLANWNKPVPDTRNRRSVWTCATKPYPEAHFATFPPDLIIPCILAGTSEKGCCEACGSPYERVVEKSGGTVETIGWQPSCKCGGELDYRLWPKPVPCTVLDPFFGSGTTGYVAESNGRRWVGIELNESYCELAKKRIDAKARQRSLFN